MKPFTKLKKSATGNKFQDQLYIIVRVKYYYLQYNILPHEQKK